MMSTPYWSSPMAKLMNWMSSAAPADAPSAPHAACDFPAASSGCDPAWLLMNIDTLFGRSPAKPLGAQSRSGVSEGHGDRAAVRRKSRKLRLYSPGKPELYWLIIG